MKILRNAGIWIVAALGVMAVQNAAPHMTSDPMQAGLIVGGSAGFLCLLAGMLSRTR